MAKYDLAFKLAVVQAYLAGEGGYSTIAKKYGIPSNSTVEKWVNVYKHLGESGLKRRVTNKIYSVQFKLNALDYKLRTGESYQEVALKFNITEPSILASWMYTWQNEGIGGLSKVKGRPTMSKKKPMTSKKELTKEQELEREVELLRAENAYLKKLRALGVDIPSRLRKQNHESSTNSEKNSD
ncbi:helix-turn-helix domain-containing protein [Virgibacillus sp. MG-45]|uniref:helix-turn-helix domain-containing protein n=1 Tax=Virgibacillus sp. MG-45 TaxID=3102791 RepID=UPI002ED855D8